MKFLKKSFLILSFIVFSVIPAISFGSQRVLANPLTNFYNALSRYTDMQNDPGIKENQVEQQAAQVVRAYEALEARHIADADNFLVGSELTLEGLRKEAKMKAAPKRAPSPARRPAAAAQPRGVPAVDSMMAFYGAQAQYADLQNSAKPSQQELMDAAGMIVNAYQALDGRQKREADTLLNESGLTIDRLRKEAGMKAAQKRAPSSKRMPAAPAGAKKSAEELMREEAAMITDWLDGIRASGAEIQVPSDITNQIHEFRMNFDYIRANSELNEQLHKQLEGQLIAIIRENAGKKGKEKAAGVKEAPKRGGVAAAAAMTILERAQALKARLTQLKTERVKWDNLPKDVKDELQALYQNSELKRANKPLHDEIFNLEADIAIL